MEQPFDAKDYREIANQLEKDLEKLINYSERLERISVPVVGNLQLFPRSSPEMRTLGQQLSLAQDEANEAIEILNALAELDEAEKREDKEITPVPTLLKVQMEAQVMSFLKHYNNKENQKAGNKDKE